MSDAAQNRAGQPGGRPEGGRAVTPPSIHERALVTWLAIFPLVALGFWALGPLMTDWHFVLRALALSLVVVPIAVYLVVPALMKAYLGASRSARRR